MDLTYVNLGGSYVYLNRSGAAVEPLKQATKLSPEDADATYNLGVAYEKLERLKEAAESYRRALNFMRHFFLAHYNLGGFLVRMGKPGEAIESYKLAVRVKPEDANAHFNLGVAYNDQELWSEASNAFKQSTKLIPEFADAWFNLGAAYEKQELFEEEIEASCKRSSSSRILRRRIKPRRGFEQAQSLGGSRRGFQTGGEDQIRLRRGPFQSRRSLFESRKSENRKGRLRIALISRRPTCKPASQNLSPNDLICRIPPSALGVSLPRL